MGLFNTVAATLTCPKCGVSSEVRVQFKYGQTWQYDYKLGERLRWGKPQRGEAGCAEVVVNGVDICPACKDEWDLYVFVSHDVLDSVRFADGTHDFFGTGETFIVLMA